MEARTGCIYCAGAFELDEREGPLRDCCSTNPALARGAARTVIQAIELGELKADTDTDQLVFEIDGLVSR